MAALMTLRAVHLPPHGLGTLRSFSALAWAARRAPAPKLET